MPDSCPCIGTASAAPTSATLCSLPRQVVVGVVQGVIGPTPAQNITVAVAFLHPERPGDLCLL